MKYSSLFIAGLAGVAFLGAGCFSKQQAPVACTMEAKQCPDGSYVGRTGPRCEFAPCPGPAQTNNPKDDLIQVTSLAPGATVTSPLHIEGKARGTWYFEASFPIQAFDSNGQLLGTAIATAQDDWMTTEFVPFTADLKFTAPGTATGTIVFRKDNPSGLPEHEDQLVIPVNFVVQETSRTIYFYDASKDKDAAGNILCSSKGLVAVTRSLPKTVTPIQDAIKGLLAGSATAAETIRGLTTNFPLEGVTLKGAALTNGKLTLEFTDPQHKTSGGACRAAILWAQIEATAKQFPEVKDVSFLPKDLFQP